MVKAQGTLREYPAGAPEVGATVTIKKTSDDTTITTDTTDGSGRWQYAANGSVGPWYWTSTIGSTVRAGSSSSYGAAGPVSLYELVHALRALPQGVIAGYLDELEVTYDGAGLDLDVATGGAVLNGIPAIFTAVTDHTVVTSRDATHPKACYLVVEVAGAGEADEGRAAIVDTCGAAAASPTLPALTQTDALWQEPLATFTLPNTGSTTLTSVTDARATAAEGNPVVSSVVRRTDPTSTTTTTSTTGADVASLTTTVTLLDGVVYDIEARATLAAKISTGTETVSIAPYINGTGNIATYVSSNATDYMLLSNTHTLGAVTGTGAAINCGLRWKVSAGTGTAITGTLAVIARPRS